MDQSTEWQGKAGLSGEGILREQSNRAGQPKAWARLGKVEFRQFSWWRENRDRARRPERGLPPLRRGPCLPGDTWAVETETFSCMQHPSQSPSKMACSRRSLQHAGLTAAGRADCLAPQEPRALGSSAKVPRPSQVSIYCVNLNPLLPHTGLALPEGSPCTQVHTPEA